jgi:flagellar hook assembly protein FlgD
LNSVEENGLAIVPKEFQMEQNFPNPFNPTTKILFQTPKETRVAIRIYDILGRLVSTLFDNNIPAGFHSLVWNAGNLSSGTYVCTAEADGQSQSIKLTLMK